MNEAWEFLLWNNKDNVRNNKGLETKPEHSKESQELFIKK